MLGEKGRGSRGKSNGTVGWGWGSPEKASATRNRGGVFAGLEEEGRSGARLRLGSGQGASRDYGESFAQTNSAGASLQWALHGEPRGGGYGDCGWAILRPNRPIKKAGEHQWVVAKLTVLRVVEEEGRGGLSTVSRRWREVEEDAVVGESFGLDERRLGWLQDFVTEVPARGIGRRRALGEELLGEALPGENGEFSKIQQLYL